MAVGRVDSPDRRQPMLFSDLLPSGFRMAAEIEVKVQVAPDALEVVRRTAIASGFRLKHPRDLERNCLFDSAAMPLADRGCALRLRQYGGQVVLTYKGPRTNHAHFKVREEIQTGVTDFSAMQGVLRALGFFPSFRYDKHREVFAHESEELELCIDETPFGCYVEIEGPPERIRSMAGVFGWSENDFLTANYVDLYLRHGLGAPEP